MDTLRRLFSFTAGKKTQRQPSAVKTIMQTLDLHPPFALGGRSISPGQAEQLDLNKIAQLGEIRTTRIQADELTKTIGYDGRRVSFTKLGKGAYGNVFAANVLNGPSFTVKIQLCGEEERAGLKAAERLRRCNLVSFRAFENSFYIYRAKAGTTMRKRRCILVTIMDKLDADCGKLNLSTDEPGRVAFVSFMNTLRECLRETDSTTFPDMKPENIGYKVGAGGSRNYYLIDLDGLNGSVATYPAIQRFTSVRRPHDRKEMNLQTDYAFAITKLLVFGYSWKSFSYKSETIQGGGTASTVLGKITKDLKASPEAREAAQNALDVLEKPLA